MGNSLEHTPEDNSLEHTPEGNSLEHTPEDNSLEHTPRISIRFVKFVYVIEFNNWHWFGSVVWTENKIKMFLFSQKNIIVLIKSAYFLKSVFQNHRSQTTTAFKMLSLAYNFFI
jgi:hypothetical protein